MGADLLLCWVPVDDERLFTRRTEATDPLGAEARALPWETLTSAIEDVVGSFDQFLDGLSLGFDDDDTNIEPAVRDAAYHRVSEAWLNLITDNPSEFPRDVTTFESVNGGGPALFVGGTSWGDVPPSWDDAMWLLQTGVLDEPLEWPELQ